MSEEFGPDFLTVTDEDGNELVLEYVDTLEHNGLTYTAFFPAVEEDAPSVTGWLVSAAGAVEAVELRLGDLTADERQIILDGCLINFYNHN